MKQSLQLKMGQQLTMTPQLQQAIRLLQLSTLDLQQEIQQALESNPMLEISEDDNSQGGLSSENNLEALNSSQEGPCQSTEEHKKTEPTDPSADTSHDDIDWSQPDTIPDLPVDTQWDDVYQNTGGSAGTATDDFDFDSRNSQSETLHDHLLWQLNLTPMSDTDRVIAMSVIDAVEPSGMLSLSAEEIHAGLDLASPVELDEVMAVLHRVQQFDPPGVASHDLKECLLIQLNQLPEDTPLLAETRKVITHYLPLLGNRDFAQLMRRAKIKEPQLKVVIALIQSLNPRPGDYINEEDTQYIVPDVFVRKTAEHWQVELNPDVSPNIRINGNYAALIKRADSSSDNTFLKDNLQEARWLLKSLQSRNETLMKVASKIVELQQGFLDYGEEAMKPMVLLDIAEAVEMHESTISRVTTQKYMHTPRGIFELKYFFSSHVSTESGGECSSTAIRAIIKKLINAENQRKPLSDNAITKLLAEQGIKVARRTIAKYRESMMIPPSNERKQLV
ncbi:RNA polymerase RpoN-/SigL-like sigma 54 subunit [Sinobacterium caligoides]|uniref:RNA polymerase sigma-54 factor n=1 Tax=Sinobacterium caligoides TaxID=933926 RepID=A0A3N2E204_9GAMM|nr:RNA polymerase factor sigma-54 [Sinobacterium caligoides]ROS06114.1 RNA polymerase RpoN-/SigL-like sigma 54 subunit [Sinobacterium caligoides]